MEADGREGSTEKGVVSRVRPKSGPGRLVIRGLLGIWEKGSFSDQGAGGWREGGP